MLNNSDLLEQHINEAREQAFSTPLLNKYSLELIAEDKLWSFYIPEFFAHYPRDLIFMNKELIDKNKIKQLNLLKAANQNFKLQESILVRDNKTNTPIALFYGWQKDYDSYCMQFTGVHRDYRRKGIYSAILDRILLYTKLLGFGRVLSYHSPSNNAVLIAKLKKNFKITSLEVDSQFGINIWLCYFHDRELERAYEFRCGHVDFSYAMFQASEGTAEELLKKIIASEK